MNTDLMNNNINGNNTDNETIEVPSKTTTNNVTEE